MSTMDIEKIVGLATNSRSLITRALALTILSAREPEKFRQMQSKLNKRKNSGENYESKFN